MCEAEIIDAETLYVDRPAYAAALIERSVENIGSVVSVSHRLGVSRQYLPLLRNGQRLPSYPMQFCLEVLAGGYRHLPIVIDAQSNFRPHHECILGQINRARAACGGIVALSKRIGVTKQYLNAVQAKRRGHRYPLQAILEGLLADNRL